MDGQVLTESNLDDIKDSIETFVNVTGLSSENIQAAGITTSNLADGIFSADTSGRLKMADNFVDANKLASNAVTTTKILDSNVTTAKIADSNITTSKIADLSVTRAKLAAVGQQVSTSCGAVSITSATFTNVTNLSVTLVSTGRPIIIALVPDGSGDGAGDDSYIGIQGANTGTSSIAGYFALARTGTTSGTYYFDMALSQNGTGTIITSKVPPTAIFVVDVLGAGTYTYTLQAKQGTNTAVLVHRCLLIAYEL